MASFTVDASPVQRARRLGTPGLPSVSARRPAASERDPSAMVAMATGREHAGPMDDRQAGPVPQSTRASVDALLAAGSRALDEARWQDAVEALSLAAPALPPGGPEHARASAGLSEALWWLGEVDAALETRTMAYASWRASGEDDAAAAAAAWLAREYAGAIGNEAASRGWLARAETLADTTSSPVVQGWVALAGAYTARDPFEQITLAGTALTHARAAGDVDIEVLALSRRGLATVASGALESGLVDLDEAMAAATGGETRLSTLATACCDLVLAASCRASSSGSHSGTTSSHRSPNAMAIRGC
ncbi:hypothetical protein [Egicoccus sp. AB-alg2]|uniref:hypothetical protein n=1 Tax=Egicoccus sp. AB-alg2 TaxID=3242693 RepID=UPI00359F08E8